MKPAAVLKVLFSVPQKIDPARQKKSISTTSFRNRKLLGRGAVPGARVLWPRGQWGFQVRTEPGDGWKVGPLSLEPEVLSTESAEVQLNGNVLPHFSFCF